MVGTSGRLGMRRAVLTPSARTRPSRTNCSEEETVPKIKFTLPEITSGSAAVPPR